MIDTGLYLRESGYKELNLHTRFPRVQAANTILLDFCIKDLSSRMLLRLLPAELHVTIFELACSADMAADVHSYWTARSLCLVSRHSYSITIPIMYRMLLVDGRTKASLLSRTFQSRPELGAFAQHVFLSDHSRRPRSPADDNTLEVLPTFAFEFPGSRKGRIERLRRMKTWLTEREQMLSAFRSAIYHILCVVSPRIQTLSICLYGHYDDKADNGLAGVFTLPFPSLTELRIRDNVQPQPNLKLQLPSLERLHLAGGNPPYPFATLGTLAESCPRLAHILLTEPFINDEAATMLELLLRGHVVPGSSSIGRPRKLVDMLQSLVLKSNLPADSQLLREVYKKVSNLSIYYSKFKFIRPQPLPNAAGSREVRYPLDEALRDWTKAVTGSRERW
ncbi:hypothetical protein ACEPAH_5711 [Sanghuangporus vaninii]